MDRKKEREIRALAAACKAGLPPPAGKWVPGERPDFQIEADDATLGVELAELMPPPRDDSFNPSGLKPTRS